MTREDLAARIRERWGSGRLVAEAIGVVNDDLSLVTADFVLELVSRYTNALRWYRDASRQDRLEDAGARARIALMGKSP